MAYQTDIKEAFLNYKRFAYAKKKKIAWLWKCTFCLFFSKFIFSTAFELDSTRLTKKEYKSRLGQKRHTPKEQRFRCCISEPLKELCWSQPRWHVLKSQIKYLHQYSPKCGPDHRFAGEAKCDVWRQKWLVKCRSLEGGEWGGIQEGVEEPLEETNA